MRRVDLTLPGLPPRVAFPRQHEGRHYQARSGIKRSMAADVMMLVQGTQQIQRVLRGRPFERARVTITWRSPRGNFDADNALAAMKGWIDGLVRGGVLVNDTVLRVSYVLSWERADRESTEFEILERPEKEET